MVEYELLLVSVSNLVVFLLIHKTERIKKIIRKKDEALIECWQVFNMGWSPGLKARAKMLEVPEDPIVQEICKKFGYGAVMDSASRMWYKHEGAPKGSSFTVGPCVTTVENTKTLIANALKEK